MAHLLFNLYFSDISETLSKQFQYADDIALTYQANSFSECETSLLKLTSKGLMGIFVVGDFSRIQLRPKLASFILVRMMPTEC
jgi:hypothetical protein